MAQGRPGRKRERQFLSELKRSFLERKGFYYKIPDMPHFQGAKFRFDIPKPFDAVAVFAGKAIAIEAKVISRFKSFTLSDLRPSQIEGLEAWTRAGCRAFVFIMLWQQGYTKNASSVVKRLYVFPWERLRDQGRITKVELVASPYYQRYGINGPNHTRVYRFNIDEFLISLIMD